MKNLIDLYVLEEVFFREAIALGMNDSLKNYIERNPSKFSSPSEEQREQAILAEWKKEHRDELKELMVKEAKSKYRVVPDSKELQQLVETPQTE